MYVIMVGERQPSVVVDSTRNKRWWAVWDISKVLQPLFHRKNETQFQQHSTNALTKRLSWEFDATSHCHEQKQKTQGIDEPARLLEFVPRV